MAHVPERRQLAQGGPAPGLYVEVFPAYGSASAPPTLPIPAGLQPARVATAANLSYASANAGGVFTLAGASTYFGLRFSGGRRARRTRKGRLRIWTAQCEQPGCRPYGDPVNWFQGFSLGQPPPCGDGDGSSLDAGECRGCSPAGSGLPSRTPCGSQATCS